MNSRSVLREISGSVKSVIKRREVIYLVAPTGAPNYGDEFIARSWLRYLAVHRPQATVVLDCHTPGQTAVLMRELHPRLVVTDTLWRIVFNTQEKIETGEVKDADRFDYVQSVISEPGQMAHILDGIELLVAAASIHFLGGGYLNSVWPHQFMLLAAAAKAAESSGAPMYLTGQGFIPVGENLTELRKFTAKCELVEVRDAQSYEILGPEVVGRCHGIDDAWLGIGAADTYHFAAPAATRKYIFCLQGDLMENYVAQGDSGINGLVSDIQELILRWQIPGEEVAFIECVPMLDRIVFEQLLADLPGADYVPFTALFRYGLPISAHQIWISSRFHPHLLAAAQGVSGVAIFGREDYYPIKHNSLKSIGSQWISLNDQSENPPSGGGFLAGDVVKFQKEKAAIAAQIYPPYRVIDRVRVIRNFRNQWPRKFH